MVMEFESRPDTLLIKRIVDKLRDSTFWSQSTQRNHQTIEEFVTNAIKKRTQRHETPTIKVNFDGENVRIPIDQISNNGGIWFALTSSCGRLCTGYGCNNTCTFIHLSPDWMKRYRRMGKMSSTQLSNVGQRLTYADQYRHDARPVREVGGHRLEQGIAQICLGA